MLKKLNKMDSIVVIGSSNTDMVVRTTKIPVGGETILGDDLSIMQGGKGANQAVAATRAGGNVIFIARIGNDSFGKKALEEYRLYNIDTQHIIVDDEKPTGVALIIVSKLTGQNSIVVAPGANQNLSVPDIEKLNSVISSAGIVLVQLEISLNVAELSLRMAKQNNVRTILNPAPAQYLNDEFLKYVDIITPNETETEFLTKVKPYDIFSAGKAAKILLKRVNEAVIITMGDMGVYYETKTGENGLIPAIPVNAIDTTAAGDVFNGYLATSLVNGKSFFSAISMANKAASLSVTRLGAQPSIPSIEELELNLAFSEIRNDLNI